MPPRVTILQLDTDFPRVPGDVGSADSYLEAPQILRIAGAQVAGIVSARPELIDITPFADALAQARGDVIVTSCGFLSYWQTHLAALTDRPFISSALTALDWLRADHTPDQILTVTFDADSLTPAHFGRHTEFAEGVIGLGADMHLRQVIAGNLSALDTGLAQAQIVSLVAAQQTAAHRHILMECTNLPPYAAALHKATGLPVTNILTCIERAAPGTVQPRFLDQRTSCHVQS